MANAVASMAGLRGASQVVLEGAFVISSSTRVPSRSNISGRRVGASGKPGVVAVRAQQSEEGEICAQSRRSVLGLLAASVAASALVKEAQAAATLIKIEGPPPLSGGLPGTENADEARDTDLPQKQRFFIQYLPPAEAAKRAKEAADAIVGVKSLIDKKAWPYVQNGLRDYAGSLRFDLNTIISSKSKEEKKSLKKITASLYDSLNKLDYAARSKSPSDASKYYTETVGLLKDVITKIA
ncbi:unnamed protein product [Sphagnum balticum]